MMNSFSYLFFILEKNGFTREFEIDDLNTIRDCLFEVRVKWYDIGMALKVAIHDLEEIKHSNAPIADHLLGMLSKWLQKGENRRWSAIITALESKAVGRPDFAEKIKKSLYV